MKEIIIILIIALNALCLGNIFATWNDYSADSLIGRCVVGIILIILSGVLLFNLNTVLA